VNGAPSAAQHLLGGTGSQGQLAMIAAAAAAAADNVRHAQQLAPQLSSALTNGGEASRLTAAALASLGALKHPSLAAAAAAAASQGPNGNQSNGNGGGTGEYKRTRYSGIGRYRCPWPDCGYTPHFLRDLRRHMFKHTGDKKHKCDYPGCDFVSVWKTSLLQHQRKKHYGVSASIQLRSNNHRVIGNVGGGGGGGQQQQGGNPTQGQMLHSIGEGPPRSEPPPRAPMVAGAI